MRLRLNMPSVFLKFALVYTSGIVGTFQGNLHRVTHLTNNDVQLDRPGASVESPGLRLFESARNLIHRQYRPKFHLPA